MDEQIDLQAVDLWAKFYRNFNLLVRIGREELAKLGISGPQYAVLRILQRHGDSTMSEISDELLVTAGNVTGLVDRLVHEGLVRRIAGRRDRRVVRTQLTDSGRALAEQASQKYHSLLTSLFSEFSNEEKETLTRLFDRLQTKLEEMI